ncbi:MAG TPA: reverse transcriptase family protein [Solirubrobacteraceae bacterium]|nr:reverse transcriptase family protein [Solirubrobacteraceae bacterium]
MYDPGERAVLASELARAMLEGTWTEEGVAESGAGCLDTWPSWLSALAMRILAVHRVPPTDRPGELEREIDTFLTERKAPAAVYEPPRIIRRAREPEHTCDRRWPVAEIDSVGDLAERLELSYGQLAWLADVRSLERTVTETKLRNYRYRALPRASGLPRVLEAPKARLKEIQRWVLHGILDHVPSHGAAHGFTRGRSVVSHAELHTGRQAVLRLDLTDFFASITAARVYGIFRTAGYPPAVAHILTGLSTNTVPLQVWRDISTPSDPRPGQPRFWLGRQLATPHLPQGAPTSPALANLAAFSLDRRLAGLARALGLRYSRYADDLAFSGDGWLRGRDGELAESVAEIAREEGFSLNRRKSALLTAGGRQTICGVVVNAHTNVARAEYDRLKAILHNIARNGAASENWAGIANLREHLRGRIAWIDSLNPTRGEKLRQRFAEIDWDSPHED